MNDDTEKYVTLSSNTQSYFFTNKCNNFKVKLAEPLDLKDGVWKVALTKITYPHTWWNLWQKDASVTIVHNNALESMTPKIDAFAKTVHSNYKMQPKATIRKAIEDYFRSRFSLLEMDLSIDWSYTVVPLESGHYQNAGEITEHITKTWKLDNQITSHTFDSIFESATNTVRFFGAEGMVFHKADKFVKALGLRDCWNKEANQTCLFWKDFSGTGKVDVTDTIYVYSSLVKHNNVGNAPAPLLTIVPVESAHGDTITYVPSRPEYRTLSQNYINDIELQLNRSTGDLIDFKRGVVTVTLHFKRDGIWML